MSPEIKETNPKDVIGSTKLPLDLVPDTLTAYAALGFLEGALKYGRFNWRVAGVRASIYRAAIGRHLAKWWNGEWADPKTGVPHLASILADVGIILDAKAANKLTDDRPPAAPVGDLIDGLSENVMQLKKLFADHHPYQYTIADSSVHLPERENVNAPDEPDEPDAPEGGYRHTRVYVAGKFQSYGKVRNTIDLLKRLGFEITHDWTRTDEFGPDGHPLTPPPIPGQKHPTQSIPVERLREYAAADVRGVQEADIFVMMADDSLAGAWVEMGIALHRGIPIFVVNHERWTIFLEMENVTKVAQPFDLLDVLPPPYRVA